MTRPLQGFPCSVGSKLLSVFPHVGPTSYVVIVFGTEPVTGGDTVQAAPEAGLKSFDRVEGGVTDNGNFTVRAFPVTDTDATGQGGIPSTTYILQWISNRTATIGGQAQTAGAEAVVGTNLSAEAVRLTAFGSS